MIGLVLAAGAGRRYGRPKAWVEFEGELLVERACRVLREAGVEELVVVLGAEVRDLPNARVVVNPDWESGMASSLRAGLVECERTPATTVCVMLVDLLDVGADVIRLVASDDPAALIVATYQGKQGHPVVLGRQHWQAIADSATGDSGARDYLRLHADAVRRVEVGALASGIDLDEPLG